MHERQPRLMDWGPGMREGGGEKVEGMGGGGGEGGG